MKKIYLSSLLIFTFIGYAMYNRILNLPAPIVHRATNVVKPSKSQININNDVVYEVTPLKPTPIPVITPKVSQVLVQTPMMQMPMNMGLYRNGKYTGSVADAGYGYVQVVAIISGGKISDVQFLDYPQDVQKSLQKSMYAMPTLISEAIAIQDSNVDTVSGASFTSQAYRESLASALALAKV